MIIQESRIHSLCTGSRVYITVKQTRFPTSPKESIDSSVGALLSLLDRAVTVGISALPERPSKVYSFLTCLYYTVRVAGS